MQRRGVKREGHSGRPGRFLWGTPAGVTRQAALAAAGGQSRQMPPLAAQTKSIALLVLLCAAAYSAEACSNFKSG